MAVLCSILNRREAYSALKELEELQSNEDSEPSPPPVQMLASNSSVPDACSTDETCKADSAVFRRRCAAARRDWICISS